ncbi:hypothetical protein NUH86_18125 [Sphingobium sp. JS3065]|uniref:hypothetical protein n=1 Tax=Sphingobium sp. JS3065 TaxID=2970925 RepID=UPI002263F00E|nr:hypothetical protein [Sphingobium sp. JS3065]UZW57499.1 hypothetical protein NUH86_18125 [Sphingobium sp. JS3065]
MGKACHGLIAVTALALITMCALGFATGDIVKETLSLLSMPWGRFVLADVVASFLLLSVLVQLVERRLWLSVSLFFIAALVLGSMTYCLWMLLRFRVILASVTPATSRQ